MHVVGVPKKLANYLLAKASTPHLAIEADSVRIDLVRGVTAESVRIYQKRVIAPPIMKVRIVQIALDPLALILDKPAVRHVSIVGARLKGAIQKDSILKRNKKNGDIANSAFNLEIIDSYWRDFCVNSLIGNVSISNNGWAIDDISSVLSDSNTTGQAWGSLSYNSPGKLLSGAVKTKLDPNLLIPLLKAVKMKFLPVLFDRFEVGDIMPYCNGTFTKELYKGGPLLVNAHVEFEKGKYRNVYLTKAETELKITSEAGKKAVVTLDPLIASRDAGTANLKLVVDTIKQKVFFDGVLTDVNPKDICGYIGILTNGFFNVIKMDSPLTANASGAFAYGNRAETDFDIDIKVKRIYAKQIYAENASLSILGRGETNYIKNLKGELYGGELTGGGYVFTGNTDTNSYSAGYEFAITAKNVKLAEMMKSFKKSKHSDLSGHMFVDLAVCGPLEKNFLKTMQGAGSISISKGEVFSLPIFGGLSKFMQKIIPGLDYVMRQSDAGLDFVIADAKMHTDKIRIDGDVLSLSGNGDYYFNRDLDFDARVKLLKSQTLVAKIIDVITYPISKLFEFKVDGTLDEPEWKPVNFSSELLKRIGLKKR